MVKSTS